ncbi:hypothetical protein HAZT_HAZT008284 [Hyalella azteca]|uniref:MTTase N-terminal domain-containing protein n=1 Tax=Hyalella azteca TaxID=294128 RepID=A0A6A0H2K5_HYAAZ|nr:hypothetical protein HAZT_HAZT008284 [Hyalella azteca]
MAERLKKDILDQDKEIDLVMGPDSYRDLPRLLALTQSGERTVNVLLSQEETYADIMPVQHIRSVIPNVALSSDFIAGFCSETEEEFQETLSLMEAVKYHFCYVFPYSLREKTPAHRDLKDDVPSEEKAMRMARLTDAFRRHALQWNQKQVPCCDRFSI